MISLNILDCHCTATESSNNSALIEQKIGDNRLENIYIFDASSTMQIQTCQHPVQFPLQCACDDGGDDVYHCRFYDALRKRKRRTRRDLLGQKLERKKEIWNDGGGLKWERRIDAGNLRE